MFLALLVASCIAAVEAAANLEPTYGEAVECSKTVSSLSDEARQLLAANQQIDMRCTQSVTYYRSIIGSVNTSIDHLEQMVEDKDTDAEVASKYRERYQGIMCAKTYEAFYEMDEEARLEVLHICIGRDSLAPNSFARHQSLRGYGTNSIVRDCPQAKAMQQRVDELRLARDQKVSKCKAKKSLLKRELSQKREREDELQDQFFGHHSNKAAIRSQVSDDITKQFCTVIMPNYKVREETIQTFWKKRCMTQGMIGA